MLRSLVGSEMCIRDRPSIMWRAILRPQLPRLGTSARSRVMLSRPLCTTVAIEPDADQLLRVMHKVQSIVGHSFQMSRIVMVGDQSSGKTSVVESLVGADISVKDQAMATRRPLLLTLMRTERGELWAQFRDGEKLHSAEAIKERIAAENDVVEGDISTCLLYTSDAADEEDSVDLGGGRIITTKNRDKG
eukprot:TRINITY_DN9408_c0_g1_i2.p1 TRINITY_DN9408_c0_g1~~TRINITY_DN9408_c0_g1_i2.p1  ORF type:complete len:216 (+),score=58.52 TRINITY_DN9408_c0_g1_i2:79-648(+)